MVFYQLKQRGLRGLTAGVLLNLAACVQYLQVDGYMPTGPGTLEAGPCGSSLEDHLRIPMAGGVTWQVAAAPARIYPAPDEQISLPIFLVVPEGVRVQLEQTVVTLTHPGWDTFRSLPVLVIEDQRAGRLEDRRHAPDLVLPEPVPPASSATFQLVWAIEGPRSQTRLPRVESFTVQLPVLRINGEPSRAGPIRFDAFRTRVLTTACD